MLELARTFQRSLDRLNAAEQAEAKQVVFDYMADPSRPGLSLHRIDRARDKRFWTVRASRDLRIVVLKEGARSLFCYIGHHDDAYRWAEGRRFEVHPVTGAAQIVELVEVVQEEIRVVPRHAPRSGVLAHEDSSYLLSLGVPESYIDLVRTVDEDGLLDLCQRLPEEAQEALLELAAGNRPAPAPIQEPDLVSDAFEHPDAKRRFWVASDEEALAQALEKPWAEWLVFLHPSQRSAVERNFGGPARVSGSAGTGKSVVAMHRAAEEARRSQGGRVLLTTFSKTLASRLADGMDQLLGPGSALRGRVYVTHLHELAVGMLGEAGIGFRIGDDATVRELLKEKRGDLDPAEFPDSFLLAEWQTVIDYWGIQDWADYKNVSRSGRGRALPPAKRKALWQVFESVIRELSARHLMSWGGVCDQARLMVEAGGPKPFRHVIVDEAQDLGPRELRLVQALAPPGPRALFFAGDTGQRIYRYKFPWIAVGINVRGRAQRLKVNYRTSEQIRRFSDRLLPAGVEEVDGDVEARRTISLLSGPEPEVVGGSGFAAEIDAIAAWVRGLVDRGVAPAEIAVFARTKKVLDERVKPAVEKAGLAAEPLSLETEVPDGAVNTGRCTPRRD